MHFHKKACSLGVIGQLLSPFFEFGVMKRGNKVLQLRIESRRRTRHIYIYICCAAAGLNLRKLTMAGGLNLRKYIYVGGRLKPPEVEVPPGSYLPPVTGSPRGVLALCSVTHVHERRNRWMDGSDRGQTHLKYSRHICLCRIHGTGHLYICMWPWTCID